MGRFERKNSQAKIGWGVGIALLAFAALGTAFLIIGYKDSIVSWMKTTGIVLLILAIIPLTYLVKFLIDQKYTP